MKMSKSKAENTILKVPFKWKPDAVDIHAKCLFRTYIGKSLEFVIYDDPISRKRIEDLILLYGGYVNRTSVEPSSIILVREDSKVPRSWGRVYSRLYIKDCIIAFSLLDLDNYLIRDCPTSHLISVTAELYHDKFIFRSSSLPISEFFKKIINDKKADKISSTRHNIMPQCTKYLTEGNSASASAAKIAKLVCKNDKNTVNLNKSEETNSKLCNSQHHESQPRLRKLRNKIAVLPIRNETSDYDSDDSFPEMWKQDKLKKIPDPNKHSKQRFSRAEKEAILKFIVAKKAFCRLKSDALYKEMEARNICPKRTYQSMKNHFIKTLLNELDTFPFLTDSVKKKLRGEMPDFCL